MPSKETKIASIAAEAKEEQPIQNLSKEVIEYLSKEIETTTTNMMVYRTKIAFAVYLGPFLLLIAVVTKGLKFSPLITLQPSLNIDWIAIVAILFNFACFLTLAYMNARIERQAWLQCNKWRGVIAKLHNDPSIKVTRDDLFDKLYGDDPDDKLSKERKSRLTYVASYAVLVVSFIMSIIILARLVIPESPTPSGTNLSTPTQKGSAFSEQKD